MSSGGRHLVIGSRGARGGGGGEATLSPNVDEHWVEATLSPDLEEHWEEQGQQGTGSPKQEGHRKEKVEHP
jgi:hypothetical protein